MKSSISRRLSASVLSASRCAPPRYRGEMIHRSYTEITLFRHAIKRPRKLLFRLLVIAVSAIGFSVRVFEGAIGRNLG